MCPFTMTPAALSAIAAAVPLAPGKANHPAPGYSDSCEANAALNSHVPGVEVWTGTNTKFTNGVGRVAIHFDRASGQGCIEIEYPWG